MEKITSSVARARTMLHATHRLTSIAADSHEATTLARLQDALGELPIDVLWIDGDHTYEGVRKDVEMYGPLVRRGGIIALHDIQRSDHLSGDRTEVYWAEVKARARTREFIARPGHGQGMGIGIIFVE